MERRGEARTGQARETLMYSIDTTQKYLIWCLLIGFGRHHWYLNLTTRWQTIYWPSAAVYKLSVWCLINLNLALATWGPVGAHRPAQNTDCSLQIARGECERAESINHPVKYIVIASKNRQIKSQRAIVGHKLRIRSVNSSTDSSSGGKISHSGI